MKKKFIFIFVLMFMTLFSCDKREHENHISDMLYSVMEISLIYNEQTIAVGTGVCVDDGKKILTVAHLFEQEEISDFIIKGELIDGSYYYLSIIKMDKELDLAILNIDDGNELTPINVSDTNPYWVDDVYVIGNSRGLGLNICKASVSCPLKIITINDSYFEMMQINITVNEGDSGGPVINDNNELVGLISFKLKDYTGISISDMSYSITISNIKSFMSSLT